MTVKHETKQSYSGPDEVLRECWRVKDKIAAQYGTDVDRFFADTRKRQEQSKAAGWKIVDLSAERGDGGGFDAGAED